MIKNILNKIYSHIFMSKEKYDNQVSKSPKLSIPVGMVILYFLVVVDRGIHPWQSNPFLLKYEAIDEGQTSSSKICFDEIYIFNKVNKLLTIGFPANKHVKFGLKTFKTLLDTLIRFTTEF